MEAKWFSNNEKGNPIDSQYFDKDFDKINDKG